VLVLETPRLVYIPTPLAVLRQRLLASNFIVELELGADGVSPRRVAVRFPDEWPGDDTLQVIPIWLARRERTPDPGPWTDGVIIERGTWLAVGDMGFKGAPDVSGAVEIGYAINRSQRGRGFATEMATALTGWAMDQPGVRRVTADCLETNAASIRVLQKAGFRQVGRRGSHDGTLLLWERGPGGADPGPRA
jgi:ribosomal-protein-alanine N-acetyltransferase